ncbi:MAG: BamA/TamA family outer membrane protein [bacterium]|nr:MAG: BamA/TamA family outer membrane protein [bacterium]
MIYYKFLFFTAILTFWVQLIPAQISGSFPVRIDEVQIVGNDRTKDHVILREIPYQFPDTLSRADLIIIKNRIQNLFLFNRVELNVIPIGSRNHLIIMVTESWYFFPVPLLFINEHDWSKISYGLQLSHYNFRGRNEKLRLGGWFGFNPSFYVNYFNPWIGDNLRLILGTGVSKRKVENKIFDFDEDRFGFDITLGRKLSLYLDGQINFALERIKFPEEYTAYTVSQTGTDIVPKLSAQIKWDTRDLFEYPKRGFFITYNLRKSGFGKKQPDFWRFEFDNRVYLPLYQQVSLAARQLFVFNSGKLPVYDRVFLGFAERIRGYFFDIFPDPALFEQYDSNQISLTSLEVRFPILPIRFFSFDNGPVIPSLYRDLKFGISGGLFIDSGITWQSQREIALNNFYSGYGFGLHLHLPYIYVLRFDLAFSDKGRAQFIIDAGVSF